ncbi:DUF411 domain-containing protein [Campylobacter sp. faydin G-24]|uniref:DUF411 domain-containing protein n=1 Tax=Campylobacter anatolicus TaxID=2829105 RepID=A0ABS5HK38_9BACT|nr:DUF411 domain-containing protein [Campylobacter anatolicus]MBR8461255.1 DUF411 domain-containing protein [Campylobacter anatolicus]MBR8464609.1 DUF411 domain-containing protein [Campylobacter anatolicus]MBR8466453.1 DUF411 domain-containing protein [Campylobacter anatolicus]
MKKFAFLAVAVSAFTLSSFGSSLIEVYKSPTCGCCTSWGKIMQKNGFETKDIKTNDVVAVKNKFKVPLELSSCHTAIIDGYVFEGHVPPDEVKRFLELKPAGAIGISVPGMPLESPGMEQGGVPEQYDVILFKTDGTQEIFATYIANTKIR